MAKHSFGWIARLVSLGFETFNPASEEWTAVPGGTYTFEQAGGVRVVLDTGQSGA